LFVSFVLHIRDVTVLNPGLETFIPERILMIFFQYPQGMFGMLPQIRLLTLSSKPFRINYLLNGLAFDTIRVYFELMTASFNEP